MNAILISVGDELTSGLTVNTNSAWMAARLAEIGVRPRSHVTVGDDLLAAASAIRLACEELESAGGGRGGLVLITGGLGPTEDDLTRQALADALQEQLVEDPDAMLQIESWFTRHGRSMAASNRLQALRPHSATIIENTNGTAPGLRARKGAVDIFVMPGVPGEMRTMFSLQILPQIREAAAGSPARVTRVLKLNTFGTGESVVGEKIRDLMARDGSGTKAFAPDADVSVGTTVHDGIVSVRIYATAAPDAAEAALHAISAEVRARLGHLYFGANEQTLELAAAELLKQNRHTLATAESCTGGLLATMLTNVAGSSAYFLRGWITYANAAKHDDLGVPDDLIAEHGAVSEQVARAMAEGARRFAESDFAIATTGVAGPDGGTAEKPVGTVWIALAGPRSGEGDATLARRYLFPGDRAAVRLRTAQTALMLLRWQLLNVPLDPPR